jgi:hypothetical protein
MIPDTLRPAADALLGEAGFARPARFVRIDGGGNNQVFRVECGDRRAALKAYFHHPDDHRDRLNAEYSFSELAWGHGLTGLPQPFAKDPTARLGLYEFVDGRRLAPEEVDAMAVEAALEFFASANAPALLANAGNLPVASEACFSIAEHLATVNRRLARLASLSRETTLDGEAADFLGNALHPLWRALERHVVAAADRIGIGAQDRLMDGERCISPSDFGFHNALREPCGRIRFIDFEYAGWDDPAKLVGDFFNQVAVPVPHAQFESFAGRVASLFPAPERNLARFGILLPVYSVKWIAIILNDFLPLGQLRRTFAGTREETERRKENQLAKARAVFARLTEGGMARPWNKG